MIKAGFEAWAHQEINGLIDEGEAILETCVLENFLQSGGANARQATIMHWLAKAEGRAIY